MLDRLILHMGPPKTGSKAIQKGFGENREQFRSNGILYPSGRWHGQLSSWAQSSNPDCTFNVWSKRKDPVAIKHSDDEYVQSLISELAESDCRIAILSYEGFSVLSAEELKRVRLLLAPFAKSIQPLIYLRHPVSWAKSQLSTRALHGLPLENPEESLRKYSTIIKRIFRVFGKESLIAREFDRRTLYRGSVFLDAVSLCDQALAETFHDDDPNEGLVNSSISLEAFQVALHLAGELSQQKSRIRKQKFEKFLQNFKGAPLILTKEQIDAVSNKAASEIEFLIRELDFEFSPQLVLESRTHKEGLSPEQSKEIAEALKSVM